MNTDTKSINSKVERQDLVNWRELQFIQQDSFKDLSTDDKHRLKASLISNQFVTPFYVWDAPDGHIYCLDGKHRTLLLEELINEGYEVPYLLPAVYIQCKDKKEASKLVLIFSSAYAKISQKGLNEFITLNDLEWHDLRDEISLPELSIDRYEQKFDVFNIGQSIGDEDMDFGTEELVPVVKPGDIFQLNDHRIACGSFKDDELVANLMADSIARIIFCDPPYNLPANFFTNKDEQKHKNFAEAAGEMSDEEFVQFLSLIMQRSRDNSVPGAIHYICMDFRHMWHMTEASRRVYGSVQPKQVCVWNKDIMANGSFYRAKQELVFAFQNGDAKHLWNNDIVDEGGFYKNNQEMVYIFKNGDGASHLSHLDMKDRIRTNVWNYPSAVSTANPDRYELKNHPTPKPVQMVADAILDTTNPNDTVIDWFLGSGTTLIASEKTGRVCRATEIEPNYVQHIICRYVKWCERNGRDVNFKHIKGNLQLSQILQTEVEA